MANAFVSWLSLFGPEDPFGPIGKLAAIWFDHLIIETLSPEAITKVLHHAVEQNKISNAISKELSSHWSPIQKHLPKYLYESMKSDIEYRQLEDTIIEIVYDDTRQHFPNHPIDREFTHEVAMASNGLHRAYISWSAINALEGAAFIANSRERQVAEQLFIRNERLCFDVFRHFAERRVPDLESVPWEKIFDLRHHPHIERFRRRISEITGPSSGITSSEIAAEVEREFIADLERFCTLCRPAPLKTLAKAVVSNIPLKLPFNPASVAFGLKDFIESLDKNKRYGWIFFGIDVAVESHQG